MHWPVEGTTEWNWEHVVQMLSAVVHLSQFCTEQLKHCPSKVVKPVAQEEQKLSAVQVRQFARVQGMHVLFWLSMEKVGAHWLQVLSNTQKLQLGMLQSRQMLLGSSLYPVLQDVQTLLESHPAHWGLLKPPHWEETPTASRSTRSKLRGAEFLLMLISESIN